MNELADWADEWSLHLRAGTVSDHTVTVYARVARAFVRWLGETHPEITGPAHITPEVVGGWVRHLRDGGRADATRRRDGIAVRLFLSYVAGEPDSGLTSNPAAGLDLPMPEALPVPVISDEELSALLRSMGGSSYTDRRDSALIRVLLDTGCRRAEVVGIDLADVDLRRQEVHVLGKGRKQRIVPFGNKTALALRKYLRVRATRPAADASPLFLSIRPRDGGSWRLTGGAVGEMLTRRCVQAGLGHLHPHQLRHTWAHDLLSNGAGESDVERLAGWSSPLMVRRYGNSAANERARDAARRLARGDRV
ncbi:tyrosine-type recombinase/integrase [Actinosynnema sp. NPDC023587]|uniref:tyrosine-type recombinase/integrase n=1 Tax=Actinosynnema sp. NPDC023587 TaxID=3154695 RepID=UPI0033CC5046